ncbi:MAG: adenosine deaminase family protein [Planctomycetes bacterium]|nr:adenosine deaminase family protein [Planctomycetota bacterium]
MLDLSEELIRKLPKTDLHLHLDGSLRLETLLELARQQGVELPADTPEGLRERVFKASYRNLAEYLQGFAYTCAVLQDAEALERVAYELAQDNQAEGVRYIEVRFAPQLHVNAKLSIADVLAAVDRGLAHARTEFNRRPEVAGGIEPPFEYGIIVCALRFFTEHFGPAYAQLVAAHAYTPRTKIYSLASLELARAAVALRDERGLQIVGFDLAGQEKGYPAADHVEAYAFVHKHFLGKTVHAGEDFGPESIFQALTDLHADRIGHGTWLLSPDRISTPDIREREAYVERLAQYVADRRIAIEVCLTSNQQTIPELSDLSRHPFRRFRDLRLATTICTDNRLVSDTTVTAEVMKAIRVFGLGLNDLRDVLIYGFKRSFYPRSYREKRAYVRRVIDYFDALAPGPKGAPRGT